MIPQPTCTTIQSASTTNFAYKPKKINFLTLEMHAKLKNYDKKTQLETTKLIRK